VQRVTKWSGAPLIGHRHGLGVRNGPGSAAHRYASLHAARRPGHAIGCRPLGRFPTTKRIFYYLTTNRSYAKTIPSLAH
jgi:hypothetical protein